MTNAFEYGDALLPKPDKAPENEEPSSPPPIPSNQPYLNLATLVSLSLFDNISIATYASSTDSAWSSSQTKF